MNKLKIEYVPIGSIKKYERNAKLHPAEQVEQIKKSIEEFGFNDPIAVWHGTIVEGHGRLMAAEQIGMTVVPVIRLDELTDEQRRAYMLVHNKTTMNSDFDAEMLDLELDDILDIDMSEFGFELDSDPEDVEITEDEAPLLPETAKTKRGDIYRLGEHRLICGDSTDPAVIDRLMDGVKADMVFTDPPYNMGYSGAGIIRETTKNVRNRIKDIIDFDAKSISFLSKMDVGSVYIFTSKDLIPVYFDIFKDWKFNILVWVKSNNPPMCNNNFLPDIEYLLYFHKGKRIWNNGLRPLDIYRRAYFSSRQEGHAEAGDVHPTMKPIKLIADKLQISSNEGSVVLDLFGGSGSTLIACEQLNRKCYMAELDPRYCDVIVERWENLTGEKARLI